MKTKAILCTLACLLGVSTGIQAALPIEYTITDMAFSPGSFCEAHAINDAGQVVGTSANLAFLYKDGVTTYLGTVGGPWSDANGINNAGQVVGVSATIGQGGIERNAFLWTPGGTDGYPLNPQMKDLGKLSGIGSYARDINDSEEIAGDWSTGNPHPFFWDRTNGMRDVTNETGGNFGNAYGINNSGQVVGGGGLNPGWLWQDGFAIQLPTLGGSGSAAWNINDNGEIVGNSRTAGGETHAYHWQNWVITDLDPDNEYDSRATAINNAGRIVGFRYNLPGGPGDHERAFLFNDGIATDLNTLINPLSGWTLVQALDINNRGQIVGYGAIGSDRHAFLLTPVPATQITAPETDLQDGPPLEMATVSPGGDGEVGGVYGIWLRGDGVGGDPNYRWSISGGPELLPDTLLATLPDTDLDGSVDDYFLTFAHLADVGANDRALTAPYTLRLEALDNNGLPIAGSESEILLLVPEPATLSILALGGLAMLRRRRKTRLDG